MELTLTLLGTGTSHGVPAIGCHCPVCTSGDPRNQRSRCSAWLQYEGRSVLIDTATEFRLQAIRAGIERLDAILFTHTHADHIFGLDDVRVFGDLLHLVTVDADRAEKATRSVLGERGISVVSLRRIEPSMEDAFMSLTAES